MSKNQLLDGQTQIIRSQSPKDKLYKAIGLLKATWVNKNGKVRGYNYGTGFLISERLLVTCSHNIYSDILHREADEIEFVPNLNQGRIQTNYYKSKSKLIIKRDSFGDSFNIAPKKQELCLILLQQPIYTQLAKLKLQQINQVQEDISNQKQNILLNQQICKRTALTVMGYPCQSFSQIMDIRKIYVQRIEVCGSLDKITDDVVIHHTAKTQVGHSGSPIIACDQNGEYYVVGIHTHKGRNSNANCGLYFSEYILKTIKQYVEELNSSLDQKIQINIEMASKQQSSLIDTTEDQFENRSNIDIYSQLLDILSQYNSFDENDTQDYGQTFFSQEQSTLKLKSQIQTDWNRDKEIFNREILNYQR